ncbi:uncharacterized protein C18orf19 homolog A-like [Hypomesus transpacificus]|uniref:uncharacterized protein C18orf19 homolog A-like n=1 Tax=Hypomesus transpacificus TaxID=137520 RepID=UPI001F0786F3|nr:uncharacterized protein C18orf19 homolog A-like [Hypomesus transpacificus]
MQRLVNRGVWRKVSVMRSVLSGSAARQSPTVAPQTGSHLALSEPRWVRISAAAWTSPSVGPKKTAPENEQAAVPSPEEADPLQDHSVGLVQRFKRTLKQYGKVMVPVHLLTSSVWIGTFYYAAMKGVNVVPYLEYIGFPERLVKLLENSQSGCALTAYAMYKIATPARYTVTLGGTSLSVKYLRQHGYLSTPPPVKEYIQDKMEETKERLQDKMEETKERLQDKMGETKDKFTGKLLETKDRLHDKMEETKDRLHDKMEETKDSFRKKQE